MSLILKGIDMPKDDDFISLEIHKGEYRIYYTKGATIKEKRGEAIQIDRPHGRLIDEKEVAKHQRFHGEDEWSFDYYFVIMDDVEKVPTILEAEKYDKRNTVYCNDCKYNESGYCTMWFCKIDSAGYCYKGERHD